MRPVTGSGPSWVSPPPPPEFSRGCCPYAVRVERAADGAALARMPPPTGDLGFPRAWREPRGPFCLPVRGGKAHAHTPAHAELVYLSIRTRIW